MCAVPQMCHVLRERAIVMLTAGMSTRAVARESYVIFSTISHFKWHYREFGSMSNRPHNHRPRGWHRVGERFADYNVVNRVPHGGGGVMLWAGISYGQWTQLHFIDGKLKTQRYSAEILRPIVVSFISRHHPMFQLGHARPMSQGSVDNSWKLKMSYFFLGLHTHQTCHPLSMFGMLWIDEYESVVQFQPISRNFAQPLKKRPQSTAWSTLCEGNVSHCMRQMVVTPDTDWLSDPDAPNFFKGFCDQQMPICNIFQLTDFLIWTITQ